MGGPREKERGRGERGEERGRQIERQREGEERGRGERQRYERQRQRQRQTERDVEARWADNTSARWRSDETPTHPNRCTVTGYVCRTMGRPGKGERMRRLLLKILKSLTLAATASGAYPNSKKTNAAEPCLQVHLQHWRYSQTRLWARPPQQPQQPQPRHLLPYNHLLLLR